MTARFAELGVVGPVRLLSSEECRSIAAYLRGGGHPRPADWSKGRAVTDRFLHDLAVHPALLSRVTEILGDDIVLWGASVVRRRPGQAHPWHTDIESSSPAGGFVSVWVGIEHCSRESSLQLITRSHTFGATMQQVAQEHGRRRGEASAELALEWARTRDPKAALLQPDVEDGDALFFDGRLWHGSHNSRARGERLALLLQYASADVPVRIPDFTRVEWPFRLLDEPRPAVILVRGRDTRGVNRVVPPPRPGPGAPGSSWVHPISLPLEEDAGRGWKPHHVHQGPTPLLDDLECHVSVLSPGRSPHPPHVHPEEEILIVLEGQGDVVLADDPDGTNARTVPLGAGSFAYYPSGQHHTIRNAGAVPVTYLMFKWRAGRLGTAQPLGATIVDAAGVNLAAGARPFRTIPLLEGSTGYLETLHAHLSLVAPGNGYEPHTDAHDLAIVLLAGTVETLGQRVEPHAVVYCSAGARHGLKAAGAGEARYLVFEFHAPAADVTGGARLLRRCRWAVEKAVGRAKRVVRRIRG